MFSLWYYLISHLKRYEIWIFRHIEIPPETCTAQCGAGLVFRLSHGGKRASFAAIQKGCVELSKNPWNYR